MVTAMSMAIIPMSLEVKSTVGEAPPTAVLMSLEYSTARLVTMAPWHSTFTSTFLLVAVMVWSFHIEGICANLQLLGGADPIGELSNQLLLFLQTRIRNSWCLTGDIVVTYVKHAPNDHKASNPYDKYCWACSVIWTVLSCWRWISKPIRNFWCWFIVSFQRDLCCLKFFKQMLLCGFSGSCTGMSRHYCLWVFCLGVCILGVPTWTTGSITLSKGIRGDTGSSSWWSWFLTTIIYCLCSPPSKLTVLHCGEHSG